MLLFFIVSCYINYIYCPVIYADNSLSLFYQYQGNNLNIANLPPVPVPTVNYHSVVLFTLFDIDAEVSGTLVETLRKLFGSKGAFLKSVSITASLIKLAKKAPHFERIPDDNQTVFQSGVMTNPGSLCTRKKGFSVAYEIEKKRSADSDVIEVWRIKLNKITNPKPDNMPFTGLNIKYDSFLNHGRGEKILEAKNSLPLDDYFNKKGLF